jgi:transcriptional regulator with PAS, ATPase and Fis domain
LKAIETAAVLAQSGLAVVIRGETGTGKEKVARLIHELSDRRKGPFIAVNCAAISKELAESYLFGHQKGAFTGATEKIDRTF